MNDAKGQVPPSYGIDAPFVSADLPTFSLRVHMDDFKQEDIAGMADVEVNGLYVIPHVMIRKGLNGLTVEIPKTRMLDTRKFMESSYFCSQKMREVFDAQILYAFRSGRWKEQRPGQNQKNALPAANITSHDTQKSAVVAMANVQISDLGTVRNVKVRRGRSGLEVEMPKTWIGNTGRIDDAFAIPDPERRGQFNRAVLKAYGQKTGLTQMPENQKFDTDCAFCVLVKPVIGRVSWANGEEMLFTDRDQFLAMIAEELPYYFTSGFHYENLTGDTAVQEAIGKMVLNEFGGYENPGESEYFRQYSETGETSPVIHM